MPLKQYIEEGLEHHIGFARLKLQELLNFRKNTGAFFMQKMYTMPDGSVVHVRSNGDPFKNYANIDQIFITGSKSIPIHLHSNDMSSSFNVSYKDFEVKKTNPQSLPRVTFKNSTTNSLIEAHYKPAGRFDENVMYIETTYGSVNIPGLLIPYANQYLTNYTSLSKWSFSNFNLNKVGYVGKSTIGVISFYNDLNKQYVVDDNDVNYLTFNSYAIINNVKDIQKPAKYYKQETMSFEEFDTTSLNTIMNGNGSVLLKQTKPFKVIVDDIERTAFSVLASKSTIDGFTNPHVYNYYYSEDGECQLISESSIPYVDFRNIKILSFEYMGNGVTQLIAKEVLAPFLETVILPDPPLPSLILEEHIVSYNLWQINKKNNFLDFMDFKNSNNERTLLFRRNGLNNNFTKNAFNYFVIDEIYNTVYSQASSGVFNGTNTPAIFTSITYPYTATSDSLNYISQIGFENGVQLLLCKILKRGYFINPVTINLDYYYFDWAILKSNDNGITFEEVNWKTTDIINSLNTGITNLKDNTEFFDHSLQQSPKYEDYIGKGTHFLKEPIENKIAHVFGDGCILFVLSPNLNTVSVSAMRDMLHNTDIHTAELHSTKIAPLDSLIIQSAVEYTDLYKYDLTTFWYKVLITYDYGVTWDLINVPLSYQLNGLECIKRCKKDDDGNITSNAEFVCNKLLSEVDPWSKAIGNSTVNYFVPSRPQSVSFSMVKTSDFNTFKSVSKTTMSADFMNDYGDYENYKWNFKNINYIYTGKL